MEEDNDQENQIEDDYYTFLNIPRNASPEEISNAYRRQSRIYHPDKHTDPKLKKEAEVLFNRTKKAYEVLSNPHKRAIYDSVGVRGLEIEGWEIVQRTKTPLEIREEYEQLEREKQRRKLLEETNPSGNVTMKINATDIFNKYEDGGLFSIEVRGMSFTQSIEMPITPREKITMYGRLETENGVGTGFVGVSARRLLETRGWIDVGLVIGEGPTVSLKASRMLTKILSCTGSLIFYSTSTGLSFGYGGALRIILDKHTTGYLTYKGGPQGSMSTTIVRLTPHTYTAITLRFGLLYSSINLHHVYKMEEDNLEIHGRIRASTIGTYVEYGAEKKLSSHNFISAMVRVGIPNGVTLEVKLRRASQTYVFPIHLSEEILPAPVFYATVVPLITWAVLKKLVIDPFIKEQEEHNKEKQREINKTKIIEMRREAKAAVELMSATFSRIRAEEESKRGLIITKALYGRFIYPQSSDDAQETEQKDEVIDVTIPLQCLVKDSRLVLHNASKSQLPGFYDPCIGEDKQLLIQYLFHSETHECIVKDNEPLRIPKHSHKVNST